MKPITLERRRLLDAFLFGSDRRLTLVEAPAGYGKTTLLQSWYRYLKAAGASATWISTDPAIEDFGDALEPALRQELHLPDKKNSWPSTTSKTPGQRAFLFIDDFHDASSFATQMISQLLQSKKQSVHIVIGTRQSPPIPLVKLRLEDQVTFLGFPDLAFHFNEAKCLFGKSMPEEEVRRYHGYAEGWPAALQLMRLSSLKGHPIDLGNGKAPPSSLDVGSFLNEQFLNSLSDQQNQFLLETAHLGPINGDLADHVRQREDSWSILASLGQSHSLVFEQTENGTSWYRYHQLLQDYLLRRQQSLGEARCKALRESAAHWLNDHGRYYSAAKLAMDAGATALAERIILDAGGIEMGIRHGAQRLERLIELLPLEWVNASPRLSLARAYLLLKSGRTDEARLLIHEARETSDGLDRELEREIVLLEVHLLLYEDRNISKAQVEALEFAALNTPLKDHLRRGVLHNFLCLFYIQLGDLEKARAAGQTAMSLYCDLGCHHLMFFMHLNLSIIDMDFGDCAAAMDRRKRAWRLQSDHFAHDVNLNAIATIMFAETALEADEANSLETPLKNALLDADNREGWSEVFLAGYETCLTKTLQNGNHEEALGQVAQGEAMVLRRSLPRFSRHLRILELDVAISAQRERKARRLARSVQALLDAAENDGFRWRGRLLARLVLARFESRFGDAEKACRLSEEIAQACAQSGLRRYQLRALVLQIIAAVDAGNTAEAAPVLRHALDLGMRHRMKGAFLREPEQFAVAVKAVVRERGVAGYDREHLQFLSTLLSRVKGHSGSSQILGDLLTEKELAVLTSLTQGNANKVIARALNLSEPTVKFHLQNVYRKLGVNSRKLAIELAVRYGIHATRPDATKPPETLSV
ncbi:MAG: LuxR C-terminal-related transcriptional regulator [Hyphomicrobiales bacterium]